MTYNNFWNWRVDWTLPKSIQVKKKHAMQVISEQKISIIISMLHGIVGTKSTFTPLLQQWLFEIFVFHL